MEKEVLGSRMREARHEAGREHAHQHLGWHLEPKMAANVIPQKL